MFKINQEKVIVMSYVAEVLTVFKGFIKLYKYFLSPLFGVRCRFLPTCSDYAIDACKIHGAKGILLTIKRISKCHPIKILGSSSGLDFVPKKVKK